MPNNNTELPKYQRIKDFILNRIHKNELTVNARIPSETELSRELGFSVITVRRALSELVNEGVIYRVQGKGSFVAPKKEPVTGGSELGRRLVAFILSSNDYYDASFMQMTKGIQPYLNKHGYSLIIEYGDDSMEKEREIISRLASGGIGGLIIFSHNPEGSAEVIMSLKKRAIPFVLIDRYISSFPVNYVASDNFDGAYSATQHLLELGHQKIAFLAQNLFLSSETDRYNGYLKALENAGIQSSPEMVFPDAANRYERLVSMINSGQITAIEAVNDSLATELLKVCERNEINIPGNLSVIGFDDVENAKYQRVPLSTVKQYFQKMGQEAARILLHAINDPELGCTKVLLPVKLIIRESTASIL